MDYYLKRKDNYEDRIQREDIPIPILPNIFRWIPVSKHITLPDIFLLNVMYILR